jgi:hypothetical protein
MKKKDSVADWLRLTAKPYLPRKYISHEKLSDARKQYRFIRSDAGSQKGVVINDVNIIVEEKSYHVCHKLTALVIS